jgi:hypothetical protein
MSLLDKASLIVTPNGYSENTIYSVIPSSGAGDLTFTRATDAWRTNSQGLVQRVAWNLLQYSEQLENAAWSKTNSSIISNQAIAPNGALTADRFIEDTTNGLHIVNQSTTATGGFYTASVYIKPNGRNWIYISMAAASNYAAYFDVQNGVVGTVESNIISASITNAGNGWYRCVLTANTNALSPRVNIYTTISNGVASYTGDGISGVYIWGAQLVEGSSALEYFPTTDRQDVPRIDYSLGGCPTLLMEPQRTNLATGSNSLSSGANVLDFTTATPNIFVSPDGTQNAMRFTETIDNGRHGFYQYVTTTAQSYTISIFTKQTGRRYICLGSDFTGTSLNSFFDLQTKSIVSAAGYTCAIQDYGNGWLRLTATVTALAGSRFIIWGGSVDGISSSYAGSTSVSQTFWGLQCEAGSYPTSYIPTTTASVTRNQDVATKVGISSLFGQTEGTVFYEVSFPQPLGLGNQVFANVSNDAGTQLFYNAFINAIGNFVFDIYIAGIYIFTLTTSAPAVAGRNRVALVYKAGAYKVFLNGVLVATSSNATPITNTISRPTLTANTTPVYYYEFIAFKSALSDSELELLTGDSFDSYAKMAAYFNYTLQ